MMDKVVPWFLHDDLRTQTPPQRLHSLYLGFSNLVLPQLLLHINSNTRENGPFQSCQSLLKAQEVFPFYLIGQTWNFMPPNWSWQWTMRLP